MTLTTGSLDRMTPPEDEAFWAAFEADLEHDDGEAAKEHLAAGFPIYFRESDTPKGLVIKQHPDGRRELVCFDLSGEKVVRARA